MCSLERVQSSLWNWPLSFKKLQTNFVMYHNMHFERLFVLLQSCLVEMKCISTEQTLRFPSSLQCWAVILCETDYMRPQKTTDVPCFTLGILNYIFPCNLNIFFCIILLMHTKWGIFVEQQLLCTMADKQKWPNEAASSLSLSWQIMNTC